MAKSRDSSDDLRRIAVATVYQAWAENWHLSRRPESALALIEHEFRVIDVPVSLEKQLRHFAVWCARTVYLLNTAELCRIVIDTAERFLADKATREELERAWAESHRITAAAGMVGLSHRCTNAAAALACAHVVNPNPFAAARWAAHYAATAQVWDSVKVPDKPRPGRTAWNLYLDGKFRKAVHKGGPDPYQAAERQLRSEIEAAQAERLRLLIPNPFIELTRRRLAMAISAQQENDREQFGEEPALMGFQQMPKLADRRFIRHRLTAQINADELPHGPRVVQRFLHGGVRQVEPLLETMAAQHAFDPHGGRPGPSALG